MLTHLFGQCTHTDAGEVIDGETGVAWVVRREYSFEAGSQDLILEPLS